MKPILLRLSDGSYIHASHFMLFIGSLAAIVVLAVEMKRTRQRPEEIYGLLLLLFVATLVGARLLYFIDFSDKLNYGLRKGLRFWKGGLSLHGGAIVGFATYALYITWRRMNFWSTGDLLTPPAAIFTFFARIGCLLSGCCYGKQCDPLFPFSMTFTDFFAVAPKHASLYPTQLMFAASSLFVFVILWLKQKNKRFDGEIALMGISIYSVLAFVIEFLRGDLRVLRDIAGISFTQNQIMGSVIFMVATGIYCYKRGRTDARSTALDQDSPRICRERLP